MGGRWEKGGRAKGGGGCFFSSFFFLSHCFGFSFFFLLKELFVFFVCFCSKFKKHKKSSMIEKKRCELGNMIQIVSKQFQVFFFSLWVVVQSDSFFVLFFQFLFFFCFVCWVLFSDACRVFHSFLFLPLVAKPDPHHVLFQVQLLCDRCDFLRGGTRLNGKIGLQ